MPHDKWVPVATAWRVFRLRIEERPPARGVAANILSEQSRTANRSSSAWGLGEVLTIITVKTGLPTKAMEKGHVVWYVERDELYRSGSITAEVRELARYKLDLLGVQGFRWKEWGTVRVVDGFFLLKRKRNLSTGNRTFCTPQNSNSR